MARKTKGTGQHSAARVAGVDLWILLALAVSTLVVYGQVIGHQFINLDDDLYIRDNPMVARGLTLPGVIWAFTTFHAANWHPLTWLSHMLDCQLFGLKAGGHLLVNVLFHTANTLLFFLFLKRVTGGRWQSAIVAALFALHPLHVESVAWAAERKDTLSTFFGLLCLLAYARYVEKPSWTKYSLVAVWLALGLMAKPMLVTWPFVLLLLDYWPLRRLEWQMGTGIKRFAQDWWPLIREKLPLFCLVIPSVVVTHLAQARGGTMADLIAAPLSWRLANSLISYARYLFLTVWPQRLAVYYPFSSTAIAGGLLAVAIVLLVAITVLAVREARRRPYLIVGWLWFLGTLVPVIGLVQIGGQVMADRYTYIPLMGIFIAIVFGLAELAQTWRIGRFPVAALSIATIIALGSLTSLQASRWRDSETLFGYTLSVTSDNLVIQCDLGSALAQQGKYAEAIPHFEEALRLKPNHLRSLLNMGLALRKQGKPAQAAGYYTAALLVDPNSVRAHWQLGLALNEQGKNEGALPEFQKAVELAPNDFDLRMDLALTLMRQNKLAEAISQLSEAVRIKPESAEAQNNLGLVLLTAGQPEQSLPHFSTALRFKPDLTTAQDNLTRAQKQIEARPK